MFGDDPVLNCQLNSAPAGAVGVGDGRARGGDRVGARPAQQLQPGAELRRPRLGARLEVERHLMQVSTVLSFLVSAAVEDFNLMPYLHIISMSVPVALCSLNTYRVA